MKQERGLSHSESTQTSASVSAHRASERRVLAISEKVANVPRVSRTSQINLYFPGSWENAGLSPRAKQYRSLISLVQSNFISHPCEAKNSTKNKQRRDTSQSGYVILSAPCLAFPDRFSRVGTIGSRAIPFASLGSLIYGSGRAR